VHLVALAMVERGSVGRRMRTRPLPGWREPQRGRSAVTLRNRRTGRYAARTCSAPCDGCWK
jgi:hypothetical protein